MIRHSDTVHHDFVIEVPQNANEGGRWIPLRYDRNCTCARHQFVIINADGELRYPTGQAYPEFALNPSDRLELRVDVHTAEKEAADIEPVVILGRVTLQTEAPPHTRLEIPVNFTFGIRSPVLLVPAATIDLGRLPPSLDYQRKYYLTGKGVDVTFTDPVCTERDPDNLDARRVAKEVRCSLTREPDGRTRLDVAMQPSPDRRFGPFSMRIDIQTDIEGGYVLRMPLSGLVIPDIELGPPGKIVFGQIPFDQPEVQSILITDHDRTRQGEFIPLSIIGHDGEDLSEHFEAEVIAVVEQPRSRRLVLRFLGKLPDRRAVRGIVKLATEPAGSGLKSVEFVAFRRR